MTRRSDCFAACLLVVSMSAFAGTAPAQTVLSAVPEFEVASIKPSEHSTPQERATCLAERIRRGLKRQKPSTESIGGRWAARCATLREVLAIVYPDYAARGRIIGGPDWVDDVRFDIEAHADDHSSGEQIRSMAARLLADRFRLQLEPETRALDAYALVVAKPGKDLGPGMRPAVECERITNANAANSNTRPACRLTPGLKGGVPMLFGGAATMEELIKFLQLRVDGPIVDRTGLTGPFSISFEVPPATPPASGFDAGLPAVSSEVSTSLREQLGLNLVPRKDQVEVLVIQHVEKPAPN
jgi:uncharacterized protein (TIGR03435 family)